MHTDTNRTRRLHSLEALKARQAAGIDEIAAIRDLIARTAATRITL